MNIQKNIQLFHLRDLIIRKKLGNKKVMYLKHEEVNQ